MRIGVQIWLFERGGDDPMPAPRWACIREQVVAAEAAGFDIVAVEDTLFAGMEDVRGCWESVSVAAAIAEATSTIELTHGMFNPPYRSPALVAKAAETLDELSGGRYTLGLGAGNSTDADYAAVGVPADKRYSRFAEAIEIIHALLKKGSVDFEGRYHSARGAEMVPRGRRPEGPPILIAAWGPKMMRLAARFADAWNGFVWDYQAAESFRPMIDELQRACAEVGRDPATLRRTVDVAVDLGVGGTSPLAEFLISGSHDEIAEQIGQFGEIGVEEVRCYVYPAPPPEARPEVIASMAGIVEQVHG